MNVTVKGDAIVEANEAAIVNPGVPVGAVVGRGTGQLTIVDADTTPHPPATTVGDVAVVEGAIQ